MDGCIEFRRLKPIENEVYIIILVIFFLRNITKKYFVIFQLAKIALSCEIFFLLTVFFRVGDFIKTQNML